MTDLNSHGPTGHAVNQTTGVARKTMPQYISTQADVTVNGTIITATITTTKLTEPPTVPTKLTSAPLLSMTSKHLKTSSNI